MFTIGARAGEEMLQCPSRPVVMDRRWKNSAEIAPNCPRCASPNTKFCYYNNYSFSQPRYFCKGCRRYWTKGGSLRNVPVGGGCRKNRRSTRSSATGISSASDRISLTFCHTLITSSSSNPSNSCPSDGGVGNPMVAPHPPTTTSSNSTVTDTDTPNIDLAAMFAKFLNHENQNSCFDPGLPAELPSHGESHGQVVEVHSPFSLTGFSSDLPIHESLLPNIQFPEEQEQQGMQMIGSDVILAHQDAQLIEDCQFGYSSDPNCYGLETLLSDEFGQEMGLWSETSVPATAVLQNFSWQTSQIQGLEESVVPLSADHHFACHPNVLLNDRWSSFDLSSSGVFSSRP